MFQQHYAHPIGLETHTHTHTHTHIYIIYYSSYFMNKDDAPICLFVCLFERIYVINLF